MICGLICAQASAPDRTGSSAWYTPNLLGRSLASFLSGLGHEMATAVLPLFLLSLGVSPINPGIIESVSDGGSTLAGLVGGGLADRTGVRQPVAGVGYLVTRAAAEDAQDGGA